MRRLSGNKATSVTSSSVRDTAIFEQTTLRADSAIFVPGRLLHSRASFSSSPSIAGDEQHEGKSIWCPTLICTVPPIGCNECWSAAGILQKGDVHTTTRLALNTLSDKICPDLPASQWRIYTDGSFSGGTASWGVVVLSVRGGEVCFHTAFGGECTEAAQLVHVITGLPILASNDSAEFMAVIHALLWLTSQPDHLDVVLHVDNMHAIMGTQALHGAVQAQTAHVSIARALAVVASSQRVIVWKHVKAHAGNPWDELADRIAAWSSSESSPAGYLPALESLFSPGTGVVEWSAFLEALPSQQRPAYPSRCGEHLLVTKALVPQAGPHSLCPEPGRPAKAPQQAFFDPKATRARRRHFQGQVTIKVVTMNVQTLYPKSVCKRAVNDVPEKAVSLQRQLHLAGVHLAGVQETRMRSSARRSGVHFDILDAAATPEGHSGTALWINRELPWGQRGSTPVFLRADDAQTLLQTPRVMAVRLRKCPIDFVAIAVHTLNQHHASQENVDDWWTDLAASLCAVLPDGVPIVMLCDANARVGSELHDGVGPWRAQVQDDAGAALVNFLGEFKLGLPSTFESKVADSSLGEQWHTWTSSANKRHRIDYVAIPLEWMDHVETHGIVHSVENAILGSDHRSPYVVLSVPCGRSFMHDESLFRRQHYNKHLLRDNSCCEVFRNKLAEISVIPWELDATSHYHILQDAVVQAAAEAFPLRALAPKKPWISTDTLALLDARDDARKELRGYATADRLSLATLAFALWAQACCEHDRNISWHLHPAPVHALRAACLQRISFISQLVRAAIRREKGAWRHDVLWRASKHTEAGEHEQARRTVKQLLPRQARPLPMLASASGAPATTAKDVDILWRKHFSELVCGQAFDSDKALVQNFFHHPGLAPPPSMRLEWSTVPTPTSWMAQLCKGKNTTAPGPDGISHALVHCAPLQLQHLTLPVILKSCLRCEEPLQLRGGPMATFPKDKRKATKTTKDFRGVLLANVIGKKLHSHWRRELVGTITPVLRGTMFGGFAGRATDFATHSLRMITQIAHREHVSTAFLFTDLVSAFDMMIRQLVMPTVDCEHSLRALAATIGAPSADIDAILALQRQGHTFSMVGVSPHLQHLVATMHDHSWLQAGKRGGLMLAQRGGKPGDPLGDIAFNYFMYGVLGDIATKLEEIGASFCFEVAAGTLSASACRASTQTVSDIAYVDDSVFAARVDDPAQLVPMLGRMVCIIHKAFTERLMVLNYSKGKTEVLLCPRGRGCRAARVDLAKRLEHTLSVTVSPGVSIPVHFVRSYVHLGGVVTPDGNFTPELRRRVGCANSAITTHRSRLACQALSLASRALLLKSHVLSTLLFNSGTWPQLSPKQLRIGARPYHRAARLVATASLITTARDMSDREALRVCGMPSLGTLLRQQRLMYFRRLLVSAPDIVKNLVQATADIAGSFVENIMHDIQWLGEMQSIVQLSFNGDAIDQVATMVLGITKAKWKRVVSSAVVASVQVHARSVDADPYCARGQEELAFACPECSRCFCNAAALASHRNRKHNIKNPIRRHIRSHVCVCCMQIFHSRERMVYHAGASMKCRQYLLSLAPLPVEEADDLDKQEAATQTENRRAGFLDRKAHAAAFRLQGPRPRAFYP